MVRVTAMTARQSNETHGGDALVPTLFKHAERPAPQGVSKWYLGSPASPRVWLLLLLIFVVAHNGNTSTDTTLQAQPAGLLALGRAIFFDARLSHDGTVSCASCHRPEKAFTDGKAVAEGIWGKKGTRNTPSLLNATYVKAQFWDGRRPDLDAQVLDPFVNPSEHGLQDRQALLTLIRERRDYAPLYEKAFGEPVDNIEQPEVTKALAAYILALKPNDTRLERFLFKRETSALDATEQRGLALFRGRAQCATCHHIGDQAAPLTDGQYHSLGIGLGRLAPRLASLARRVAETPRVILDGLISSDADVAALGRFVVTLAPADIGAFKTPSLHAVAATAPYMHDGSIATLDEALDRELYYRGRDLGHPIVLSAAERAELLAFLRAVGEVPEARPLTLSSELRNRLGL